MALKKLVWEQTNGRPWLITEKEEKQLLKRIQIASYKSNAAAVLAAASGGRGATLLSKNKLQDKKSAKVGKALGLLDHKKGRAAGGERDAKRKQGVEGFVAAAATATVSGRPTSRRNKAELPNKERDTPNPNDVSLDISNDSAQDDHGGGVLSPATAASLDQQNGQQLQEQQLNHFAAPQYLSYFTNKDQNGIYEKQNWPCRSREDFWEKIQLHTAQHRFFNRYLDYSSVDDLKIYNDMILDYKPLNGCLPHELETILRLQPVEDRAALVYTAIKPKKKESTSSQVAAFAGTASVAKNKSPRNNYHSGGHREEVEKVRYKFKQFDVESQEKWYFLADDTTEQENFCFAEEMFPESDDEEGSTSQSSSSGAASSSDGEERNFSTTSKTGIMSRKIAQQRRKIERLNRKIEKKRKAMIERPMGPTHDMPHKNFDNEDMTCSSVTISNVTIDSGICVARSALSSQVS